MKQTHPKSKIIQFGRKLGWLLLSLHTILALVALSSFSNGWWAVIFFIDMPASWPGYLLMDHVKGDFIPWLAFTALGSLWQFLWPQALTLLIDWTAYWFKKRKHAHPAA